MAEHDSIEEANSESRRIAVERDAEKDAQRSAAEERRKRRRREARRREWKQSAGMESMSPAERRGANVKTGSELMER